MEPSYVAPSFRPLSERSNAVPPNIPSQHTTSSSETHLSLTPFMTSVIEGAMSSTHGYKITETFLLSLYRDLMVDVPSKEGRYAEKVDLFIANFSLLPSSFKDLHTNKLGDVFLRLRSKFVALADCVQTAIFKEKWYYQVLEFTADLIFDTESTRSLTLSPSFTGFKSSKWVAAVKTSSKSKTSPDISKLRTYESRELRQNADLLLDMLCVGSYHKNDLFNTEAIPLAYDEVQSQTVLKLKDALADFLDRIGQLSTAWRTSPGSLASLETALLLLMDINTRRNPSLSGRLLEAHLSQIRATMATFHTKRKNEASSESAALEKKLQLFMQRLDLSQLEESQNAIALTLMHQRLQGLISNFNEEDIPILADFVHHYPLLARPFCLEILRYAPNLIIYEDLDTILLGPVKNASPKSPSTLAVPLFEARQKARESIQSVLDNIRLIAKAISELKKTVVMQPKDEKKWHLSRLTLFCGLRAKPVHFKLSPSAELDNKVGSIFTSVAQGVRKISSLEVFQELAETNRALYTIERQVVKLNEAKVTPFLLRQTLDHLNIRFLTREVVSKTNWADLIASKSNSKNPAFPIRRDAKKYSDLRNEWAAAKKKLDEYRGQLVQLSSTKAFQIESLDKLIESYSEALCLDLETSQKRYFEEEREALTKRKSRIEKEKRGVDALAEERGDSSIEADPFFLEQSRYYAIIRERVTALEQQLQDAGRLVSFVKLQDLDHPKTLKNALLETLIWKIACCVGKSELFAPTSTILLTTHDQVEFRAGIQTIQEGTLLSQLLRNMQVPQLSLVKTLEAFAASIFFGMWDAHPVNLFVGPSSLDAQHIVKFFDNARSFPHSNKLIAFGDSLLLPYRFGLLGMDEAYRPIEKEHVASLRDEFLRYANHTHDLESFLNSHYAKKVISDLPKSWFVLDDVLKATKERLTAALEFIDKHQEGLILRDLIFHVFPYAKFTMLLTFITSSHAAYDLNTSESHLELQKNLGLELGSSPLDRLIRNCSSLAVNPRKVYDLSKKSQPFEQLLQKAKALYDKADKIRKSSSSSNQEATPGIIKECKTAGNQLLRELNSQAIADLKEENEEEIRLHLRDQVLAECERHKLEINHNPEASVEFLKQLTQERAKNKGQTTLLIHDVWKQEKIYLYWCSPERLSVCQGPFELNYQRHIGKVIWNGQETALSIEQLKKHFK